MLDFFCWQTRCFDGNAPVLSEKGERLTAIKRLKVNKSADEKGLVAELFSFVYENFSNRVLEFCNGFSPSPEVPVAWRKTICNMLPKHGRAKVPAEYRPIASIRLLYKTFAYMTLGRVEALLETAQLEEQHRFRSVSLIDKSWSMNMPIWIISLDPSKVLDRVRWRTLWRALSQQGTSYHMIWILQSGSGINERNKLFVYVKRFN